MTDISLKKQFETLISSNENYTKYVSSIIEINKKINAGIFNINMFKNYKNIISLLPTEYIVFGCSGSTAVFLFSDEKFWVLGPVGSPGYKDFYIEQFSEVKTKRIKKVGVTVRGELLFGSEKIADCINILMEEEVLLIAKEIISSYLLKKEKSIELQRKKEHEEFKKLQISILHDFDKDGNGEVDIIEGNSELDILLKNNQKAIVDKNTDFLKHLVKVSSFLKNKKNNIQKIFDEIKSFDDESTLIEYSGILKNEIYSYESILFHALNMVVSLIEDDMITFYEIYESFDRLDMFNSKWENEIANKLSNIGDGLTNLMYSINEMNHNIAREITTLSYDMEKSSVALEKQLKELNSGIEVNNMISTFQSYQMYNINRNLKN